MVYKILYKMKRILYFVFHPMIWGKGVQINGIPDISGWNNIYWGKNISVNENVYLQGSKKGHIYLGNNVTLSRNSVILTSGIDTNDYRAVCKERFRKHVYGDVNIGDGTWICANVVICPGVTVAKDSIIAAGGGSFC